MVAAIRPCNVGPAPENLPIVSVSPDVFTWYAIDGFGPKYPSIRPELSARYVSVFFWKYLMVASGNPALTFASFQSTRIFSWFVPDPTAIVFPAMSLPLVTRQVPPFFASNAMSSLRYVAKSYFCLRFSVTVMFEKPTSYLAESRPTNRFSQLVTWTSGFSPSASATRYAMSTSSPIGVLLSSA